MNGEENIETPEDIWNKIKENHTLLNGKELRSDFENFDSMMEYYSSLSNTLIIWKDEESYIQKLRVGMKNSRMLAKNLNIEDYEIEKWMNSKIGDIILQGRFDIVSPDEIIDLKTGRESEDYYLQLVFYALISYIKNYIIPRGKLIYLQSGKVINLKFNFNTLNDLMDDVKRVAIKIKNNIFTPRKGAQCNLCPYRFLCDY